MVTRRVSFEDALLAAELQFGLTNFDHITAITCSLSGRVGISGLERALPGRNRVRLRMGQFVVIVVDFDYL